MDTSTNMNMGLTLAYSEVQRTIAALQVELDEMPARMRATALAGQGEALMALQDRLDRLPRLIATTRIQATRMHVKELEGKLPEVEAAFTQAADANEKAQAKLEQARLFAQTSAGNFYSTHEQLASLRRELIEAKQQLASQAAQEGRSLPPVVRNTGWTGQGRSGHE